MAERAIQMEGTVTGEHGVGMGKRDYLASEMGQSTVDAMRKARHASTKPFTEMESGVKGRWDLLKAEVMGAPQVKQSDIKALQEAAAEFEEEPVVEQKQAA
ncbi:MAG: D-lactate ferricytochrome c oxidoreductase [Ramalina farinacea]|uniref:D-lactate ferricytochrome c oxidoreductase n=1 Tax=Ramalina farinacea TaxID=258253 RepID=A0AA43QPR3_9LECA|nr:D-lactate ferricytochrome c oxidoreductase [Ramalina farinacea]